jgi:superfamily II DNA or RNA helicase
MNTIEKGTAYEIYIKKFLENNQTKTWLWKDIPENILRDAGILGDWNKHRLIRKENKINSIPDTGCDILLKNENEYIFIQCKNFTTNSVTIQHLAGFYMMVVHFKKKGIVYYTTKLEHKFENIPDSSQIDFIKKEFNPNIIKKNIKKIKNPFYFQIEAYEKLINSKRSILNLPCGTGKTYTSIMIAKDYDNIVIISPLLAYAKQNLELFHNELENYQILLINSEGTRNMKEITKDLNKNKKNILSLTYKSVDILIKILDKLPNKIIIIDEFHNLSKNDIFDQKSSFYKLLYSDSKILFMSATPRFFNLENSEYKNEDIFGKDIYSISMGKCITEKYICDYEIYLPNIKAKNNLEDILNEIELTELCNDLIIKAKFIMRGMLETGSKKCIIYLRNHEETVKMVKILNELNYYFAIDLYVDSILCEDNFLDRDKIINDFTNFNGYSIICSVAILNECINIIKCDSIFISYPSESKISNIQRLCRANRKDEDNMHKIAKIFLWCNEFDDITLFVSHLKEFDENFIENKVLILNIDEKKGGILERNKKEYQEIYNNLDNIIISIRRFGYGIDLWKKNLNELKEFINKNKRRPVEKSQDIIEKKVGSFLKNQLYDLKNNSNIMKLPEVQQIWNSFIDENKSLFFSTNEIWSNKLNELEEFIKINERLPSQCSTESEENIKFAKWIVRNNEEFDKNEKAMKDENTRVEWIEFKNKYSHLFNVKINEWNKIYDNLINFIKINNKLPVENKDKKDEYNLRIWYKTQEKIYNKNKFENDIEKKNKFEILISNYQYLFGKVSNLELWIEKYDQCIKYIEKNNQLPREKIDIKNISDEKERKEKESLKSLGTWKSNVIQNAKTNFVTYILDIDYTNYSIKDKGEHIKKLEKYKLLIDKDNEILAKEYSKLGKKDKSLYDKTKIRVEERNIKIEEERYETSEKLRLWNDLKNKFPNLF